MGVVERFEGEFLTLRKRRVLHASLTFTEAGLALGAGTVLAPVRRDAVGAESFDLSCGDRILAALTAAFMAPVDAALLGKLRRACHLWAGGEKSLAQIYLAQLRLPRIDEEQAFRLFLADRLMASGFSPRELCKQLGFALPAGLRKFGPDQPRDDHGRWTSSSDSGSASPGDVREGRSVSPGGHRGEDSEDDKIDAERRALGEEAPEEDRRRGRPIDPLGQTPLPVPGAQGAAGAVGPKPADFIGEDFGKYGVGVAKPDLEIDYWTYHANKNATARALSFDEMRDVVANPLLVTRQSNSRFYYLNDNGAVVVDDYGRVVTNYGSSDFKPGVINMLKRVHSGEN